jgi:hypothetical protein
MMKRILGAILLTISVVGTGCQTTLDAARTDIERTWRISKVFRNGTDDTSNYIASRSDYTIQFSGAGNFVEAYFPSGLNTPFQVAGTWIINGSVTQLSLTDQNQSRVFRIDQLSETNFDLSDLGSQDDLEIKLVPN